MIIQDINITKPVLPDVPISQNTHEGKNITIIFILILLSLSLGYIILTFCQIIYTLFCHKLKEYYNKNHVTQQEMESG